MLTRLLSRSEIPLIWTIDRSEHIEKFYRLQDGVLVLEPRSIEAKGWPGGEPEADTPIFYRCFDAGGAFYGTFDGAKLAGIAIVDPAPVTSLPTLVQFRFLHVDRAYRKLRLGSALFASAAEAARRFGASGLYISATPTENTVNFYRHLGCTVLGLPDPELFALEPDDIHLQWLADTPGTPVSHAAEQLHSDLDEQS